MALEFVTGGLLLLCAVAFALPDFKGSLQGSFQQSLVQPQVPIQVECKAHYLLVSVDMPPSGLKPRFEAVDAAGAYSITERYAAQCGYTYSVQPLQGRVFLRASYFSCHVDNQIDKVFNFMFRVVLADQNGLESFFNVSQTCTIHTFSPREVVCEENYLEVSVKAEMPCLSTSIMKAEFSETHAVAHSSAVEAWQVILQQEGQRSKVMSTEEAASLGYTVMGTSGRLVFRTAYGQPHATVKMVNDVAVEVIHATVFFRQTWMVVMMDLVASCSRDEGRFDGFRLQWRTPAIMTPLAVGLPVLRTEYMAIGVDGEIVDELPAKERGYSVMVVGNTVESSIPFGAEGGYRKSFIMDNVYYEIYTVQLAYQQTYVDQSGMVTKKNVVRQISSPLVPRVLYTVNKTNIVEEVFTIYLGNVPTDVELVAMEFNGQEISVLTAIQMGYSVTRVSETNLTFAYIIRVPFQDQFVVKKFVSEGVFEYALNVKWTLNILPQMETYYHYSFVSAVVIKASPPVFESTCAANGVSFRKEHRGYDHLWDFAVGRHRLTPQLMSERGYIVTNDSSALIMDIPLFTAGYTYEDITLQQFSAKFEIFTRNAKTLETVQSSARRCLFQTTELLVCSPEGVMTVVSDITKAIPNADPARTTLLDPSCGPKETDERRVLFSFGLNTCGTRVEIDQRYVTYENEIKLHEVYSSDAKPVITRDAAYRVIVKCIYPVRYLETLSVDLRFKVDVAGIGVIQSVMAPPKIVETVQVQESAVYRPSFQATVIEKPVQVQESAVLRPSFQAAIVQKPVRIQESTVLQPSFQTSLIQKPINYKRMGHLRWSENKHSPRTK
ncbi:zona pellucida protein AX 4 precursor [Danio rerio]|uniref:Zona pellucida protein AX 4 n=1 Tax=Danio rerio TaxID=7955 RepID=F1R4N4_DANRE|nr:zona pellucida protein AX 4 precursor [Danio rerio]|eukprot:NP_001191108.1 egg envelope glycoprotein-like precursor [Danio rerio]